MGKKFPEGTEKPDVQIPGDEDESSGEANEHGALYYPAFIIDTSTPIPTIKQGIRRRLDGVKRPVNATVLAETLREWGVRPSEGKFKGGSIVYKRPIELEEEDDEE